MLYCESQGRRRSAQHACLSRAIVGVVLGVISVTTVLAAQELRDTLGPLERKANPEATTTVVLVATIDESGCVAEIRTARQPVMITATVPPTETVLKSVAEAFMREAVAALRRWQYGPPAQPPISFAVSFTFKPGAETSSQVAATVPPPPPAPSPAPRPAEPVRVGSVTMSPTLMTRIEPVYPARALSARVQGTVIVEARIDAAGKVSDATVLRSVPLLDQAALDAVRQWVYAPTCFNGAAIPLVIAVAVPFKLP